MLILCALLAVALGCSTLTAAAAPPAATPAKKKCKRHKKKGKGKKKAHKRARKCKKKRSPVTPPPVTPPVPTPTPGPAAGEYVSLGDSLAAGVGASSPATGYVSLLYTHYQATLGVTSIDRLGVSGETSASLLASQLGSAVAEIDGPSDTRVVTIDIGGNDLLGGCAFGSDACTQTFKDNFAQALGQLRAALAGDPGDEPLIAMAYYNPDAGGGANEATLDAELLGTSKLLSCADTADEVGLNDAIAQVASAHGALLANPYPAFEAPGAGQMFMSEDHIHANDLGHQAIADAFIAARGACS
jgi:lysophospholipase L1-like esterase